MKLSIKNNALAIAIMLFSTQVMAQTKSLNLKDLIQIGLEQNYNIQLSKLDEAIVEKQIVETRGLTLPQVNGTGNIINNYKRQVLVLPAGLGGGTGEGSRKIEAGTNYSSALGVEATQALFDVAALQGLKAAKAGRVYARVNTQQTQEQVVNDIAQQYYQILSSMEEVKLQHYTIEIMQQLVQASEGKYNNGLLRKVDVDRLKVNLINAQSKLTQAQNDVDVKTNQLKVTLGLPYNTSILLDSMKIDETSLQVALQQQQYNPDASTDLKLLDTQIKLSTLERNATRAANYPKLNAFANYNYNMASDKFSDLYKGTDPAISYGMGSVGVRLSIPLFSGFSRSSKVAQNNIKIHQLEKQRQATAITLEAKNESARIQMENTLTTARAQQENVKLSETVYKSNRSNYTLGLSSLTDLLDSQTSFLEAKNIYTKSIINYKLAELELMRSNGTILNLIN